MNLSIVNRMLKHLLSRPDVIMHYIINYFIMTVSMLSAVQLRFALPLGKPLGEEYQAYLGGVYFVMVLMLGLTYLVLQWLPSNSVVRRYIGVGNQFRTLIVASILTVAVILVIFPDLSQLQMMYYGGAVAFLGLFLIIIPGRLRTNAYVRVSILDNIQIIYEKRYLLFLWLRFQIEARYAQTILGIMWVILLPILNSVVMAFAFTVLLGARSNDVPFVAFILSGSVPFYIFQAIVTRGKAALGSMMGVFEQIYFPREMLILLLSLEVLFDFSFMFIAMVFTNLFFGIYPNQYYPLLIIPIGLLSLFSLGLGFILSWLSLLIRDLEQLIGVVMQLLFYMTVLFQPNAVSPGVAGVAMLNPVLAIVEAFRAIVIYNRLPDFASLYVPVMVACAVLYTGYVFFKVNEDRIVDFA